MRLLKYLYLIVLLASNAYAQEGIFSRVNCTDITAPVNLKTWCLNQADGKLYSWRAGKWDDLTAIGGGGGTVTSVGVTGTANQITVTGSSPITTPGSLTFSIPTNPTLPGTTSGTFSGNWTGRLNLSGAYKPPFGTFAEIPATPEESDEFTVTDCLDSSCSAGAGAFIRKLRYDGAEWIPIGDGNDSGVQLSDSPTWTGRHIFNGLTEASPLSMRGAGGGATYGFDVRVNSSLVPEFLPVCADVQNDCDRVYDIPTGKFYEFQINSASIAKLESTGFTRLVAGTQAQGDILFFDGTSWVRLAPGTAGQCLKSGGAGANPSWAAC
jgi:hypothetical protein